ncbi:hypothetical protein TWF696_001251 [Orbilia brochopaga]|uniref:Uncharacterized protein n=1 Tax=Orbilia brochopaga TaxID=3140254 RepID=A0AAV9U8V5_9PEZI
MHFAYYKLVVSTNPATQRYYTAYTTLLLCLQLYIFLALAYHFHAMISGGPHDGFDASLVFHGFLTQLTTVSNIIRLSGHAQAENWSGYMAGEFRVGRFDGVIAVLWMLPYVLLPFAIFGDFEYAGIAYLIPLPMIFGYALARWLHRKTEAAYRAGGGYDKLDDVDAEEGVRRPDTELPVYEA